MNIQNFFEELVKPGVSDLHLVCHFPPYVRAHGKLKPLHDLPVLQERDIISILNRITDIDLSMRLMEREEIDFTTSIRIQGIEYRFRVNVALSGGSPFVVMRRLDEIKQAPYELGIPERFYGITQRRSSGIVLVTGTTGSGKSTTLASILAWLLKERPLRVVTLEDPVEYLIPPGIGVVTQREIGWDSKDFVSALRAAMRQDPDIILVGEIRDAETMEAALWAAETGHLVFSTLHVHAASLVPQRLASFVRDARSVLFRYGNVFAGAFTQTLIPTDTGRVLCWELLDESAGRLIVHGRTDELRKYMAEKKTRMVDVMASLLRSNTITYSAARAHINIPEEWPEDWNSHLKVEQTKSSLPQTEEHKQTSFVEEKDDDDLWW